METRGKIKRLLFSLVVVAGIVLTVFMVLRNRDNDIKFRTAKAVRGSITQSVTATGTVNAVTTVLVGTQVSGTIKKIYADFNSKVRQGQTIALIDPAVFEAQVDQAKANLMSAAAGTEKAETAHADARRSMDRNRELFSKGLIARSDLDTAEAAHDTAKTQVTAGRAQVNQAEAALRLAETNLKYTKILSPVNGTVISRNVDAGQTVAASFQTPTLFTIAQDLTKMQINTSVDEADIGSIKPGQNAEFTVDAYPDITFKGKVSQVRNAPVTVQNVVTYDVVIYVDNPDLRLKPGMTANVSIIVFSKKDVLKIPNTALRFRPAEKGRTNEQQKGAGLWIPENGKMRRIPVSIGISDGTYTEVSSGSLTEGQDVIVEALTKAKTSSPSSQGPRMF